MAREIVIGCCGWSYFRPKEFRQKLSRPYGSTLQAYAQLFSAVEVNSTFYRIPQRSTAERWYSEATQVNPRFLFTVKAYHVITHSRRFGKRSVRLFEPFLQISRNLRAPVVLFQTPASFKPTATNIKKIDRFFRHVDRDNLQFAWEPRGSWFKHPDLIDMVCMQHKLIVCVDPFRNEPVFPADKRTAYVRLHGFGRPSMYRYDFSKKELEELRAIINSLPQSVKRTYIFFNNVRCYQNALEFLKLVAP